MFFVIWLAKERVFGHKQSALNNNISDNNLGFGALAHLPILTLTLKELVLLTILLLPSNSEHL